MVSSTNPGPSSATSANTKPALILSGTFLYANLPSASSVTAGTLAFTSDQGTFVSNGTAWAVSPGIAVPNTSNGGTETVTPQSTTGLNVNAGNWYVDMASSNFTGNIFNDPVMASGYNVSASVGVNQTAPDPFSIGLWAEGDYQVGNTGTPATTGSTVTASASNSTTVLVDSAQTWNTNSWAQWVLYNITSGGRALITSNTSNTITTSAPMVLSDGISAARANQTGDSYNIYDRLLESYLQSCQITSNGAAFRRMRPIYFTFDKATAAAQGALASGAALSITSATAANPPVFTTSVNHGMQAGSRNYVKFGNNGTVGQSNLAGGTWGTNLNSKQYLVTVISATTFSVAVNATGYGTYTASSGTCTVEGGVNASSVMIDPIYNGFLFQLPSWNTTTNDNVFVIQDSLLTLYGRDGSNSGTAAFLMFPAPTGNCASSMGFHGVQTTVQWSTGDPNVNALVLKASNQSGANLLTTAFFGSIGSDTVSRGGGVGANADFKGIWNITNFGQTASLPMLYMRPAASQTGDAIQIFDGATGNTTKLFSVNASGALGVNSTTPPAKVTGFGTPTGTGVISNFPGATATLAQCSQAIAQLITDMKGIGFYGA